jgi:DNA-binding NarL/FixJ family response regulator
MSTEMIQNNKQDWRRSKVRELLVKGYNHYEIANTLQIPRPTITKDIRSTTTGQRKPAITHPGKITSRI